MKRIVRFAVEYPVTILMFISAVILLGVISFNKLGMDLFPELNNPNLFIELKAGESPPEEIETRFIEDIEATIFRLKNVTNILSTSKVGFANITVEYAWNTDMDNAFLDIQKSLSGFKQQEDVEDLIISQYDPNAVPIILLGFSHPEITDMNELRRTAESYLRNELVRLEGIAEVQLLGKETKEVVVETNSYILEAHSITPSVVSNRIQEYNRNISSGSITEMGTKYIIKGISEFTELEDIKNIIVTYKQHESGQSSIKSEKVPVFLKDVADVKFKNKIPDNIVYVNGRRSIALAVYKETNYNTVKAVSEFTEALNNIKKTLPEYEFNVIDNQGEFINTAINEVQQTLLYGIILAIIILFVFLRRIGMTAIISTAIPISIIATFNLMYFNGLTLNIMTLGGLALGAGMLVDNAIVVMENIFRNIEEGKSVKESSVTGTSQVAGAITASTVTTIVVFLPIVYLHGAAGELFKDQAWTVAFSLLSSLIVAILVIPMFSSKFLKKNERKPVSIQFTGYSRFLKKVLNRKGLYILFAAVLVIGTIMLLPYVGSEFIPKTESNEYSIELKLPEGTELYRTANTTAGIEKKISSIFGDKIETLYSISGYTDVTESEFQDENTATIKMILKKNHNISTAQIFSSLNNLFSNIPDLEVNITQQQTALEYTIGTESAPLIIDVMGEDLNVIQELTEKVKSQAMKMEELFNVKTSFDEGRPEINIKLDPIRAGLNDVNVTNLNSQLEALLEGVESSKWEYEGELIDITVKLPRKSVSEINDIEITTGNEKIQLSSVADIVVSRAPVSIIRQNQTRTGRITAHIREDNPIDQVVKKLTSNLKEVNFPPEYKVQISGEEQERRESFQNLKFALILSLILVYMVLASQFESLIHPFTIILSIPLAAVGGILIFFILGIPLNIMAYIGIIMLVGIAVNNSIILVDAINRLKRSGLSRYEAIITGGQQRVRPIIITSLTTILALFPLTIGFGEGAALRAPLALAVIGGLFTSTLLTLVVIPCIYAVFDGIAETLTGKNKNEYQN